MNNYAIIISSLGIILTGYIAFIRGIRITGPFILSVLFFWPLALLWVIFSKVPEPVGIEQTVKELRELRGKQKSATDTDLNEFL